MITDTGKIVSKSSVEHVIRDDYLNDDKAAKIKEFNEKLTAALDDSNFAVGGDLAFDSMYMEDIDVDENPGVDYSPELTWQASIRGLLTMEKLIWPWVTFRESSTNERSATD